MDRLALGDDQTDSAARALLVIGGQIVGRHPIQVAKRGEMRLEDGAVAQRDVPKRERREQMREGRVLRGVQTCKTHLAFPFDCVGR